MKVMLSVNDNLMKKIDQYVKENYLTRSSFITMVANKYLVSNEKEEKNGK